MHEAALTLGVCIWSLIDMYALGFLGIPYLLCCSSGGGSLCSVFRLTSQPCSCGTLVLSNLPVVFLSQDCIKSYENSIRRNTKQKRGYLEMLLSAKKYKQEI